MNILDRSSWYLLKVFFNNQNSECEKNVGENLYIFKICLAVFGGFNFKKSSQGGIRNLGLLRCSLGNVWNKYGRAKGDEWTQRGNWR